MFNDKLIEKMKAAGIENWRGFVGVLDVNDLEHMARRNRRTVAEVEAAATPLARTEAAKQNAEIARKWLASADKVKELLG